MRKLGKSIPVHIVKSDYVGGRLISKVNSILDREDWARFKRTKPKFGNDLNSRVISYERDKSGSKYTVYTEVKVRN